MSDHTVALPGMSPGNPPETSAGSGNGRRGLIAVVASVLAVVLIAGGGLAAWRFLSAGGPRPAEVLPASTFAMVAVDLDPSGGQKIEAIKTLRKLPSFRKQTGITTDSDVVKALFEETIGSGDCKSVDYAKDVKPWIGNRAGVGGVLVDGKPVPVLALQITDADKASTGFVKLAACTKASEEEDFGYTITDDYVVVSDSEAHAKTIVAAAAKAPLAEDADYRRWTEKAGGAGIVNAYLSPKSVKVLTDSFASELDDLAGTLGTADAAKRTDEITDAAKNFKGAAATLRFADSGMELSFAGGSSQKVQTASVGSHVAALPADTAAALAFSIPDQAVKQLKANGKSINEFFSTFLGSDTGLDLPDDLIALLGDSMSLSLGGDAPADLDKVSEAADVPVGLLVRGDEARIQTVIKKIEARTGVRLADVPASLASSDGEVALSTSPAYAAELVKKGSLGEAANFKDVVTHAKDAQAVLYVSLDGQWADTIRKAAASSEDKDSRELAADLSELRAMGASVWSDGQTSHGQIRIVLK